MYETYKLSAVDMVWGSNRLFFILLVSSISVFVLGQRAYSEDYYSVIADGYVFEPNGVVSGLITDAQTGKPVIGAKVSMRQTNVFTDENGYYSFNSVRSEGDYSISISSEDYVGIKNDNKALKFHVKNNSRFIKHFQLQKACKIEFHVSNEQAEAVSDAVVSIYATHSGHKYLRVSGSTDEKGNVTLGGFEASDKPYTAMIYHYGTETGTVLLGGQEQKAFDYAPAHTEVTLKDPYVIAQEKVVLVKGETVNCIAKYSNGKPARGCKIGVSPDWWPDTGSIHYYDINADGTFAVPHVVKGRYNIRAMISEKSVRQVPTVQTTKNIKYETSWKGRGLFSTDIPLDDGKPLFITVPEKSGKIVEKPKYPPLLKKKIVGLILDAETGRPITNFKAKVKVNSHFSTAGMGSMGWTEFENENGMFNFEFSSEAPSFCTIQAFSDGYAMGSSEEIELTENAEAFIIRLRQGGAIEGIVIDTWDNPISGAKVFEYSVGGMAKSNGNANEAVKNEHVVTDENGMFYLPYVAAGIESLNVVHPDYPSRLISGIIVDEGYITDAGKIVLYEGGIVEGYVFDKNGKGIKGVELNAHTSSGVKYPAVLTDSEGYYKIENLREEPVYIVSPASTNHEGVAGRGVMPKAGESMRVNFGGGPVISGQLVLDGKPMSNYCMQLYQGEMYTSNKMFTCYTTTDQNGHFSMSAGSPSSYSLMYDDNSGIIISDIEVGYSDINVGRVPVSNKTLNLTINVPDNVKRKPNSLYIQKDTPEGKKVFFSKKGEMNGQKSFEITLHDNGIYYVVTSQQNRPFSDEVVIRKYQYPIELSGDGDEYDCTVEIETGNVTMTGEFPKYLLIDRFYITSEDGSFHAQVENNYTDYTFKLEGLKPGNYFVSPSSSTNFNNAVEIIVPEVEECFLDLNLLEIEKLAIQNLYVHVFDENGLPCKGAKVWITRQVKSDSLMEATTERLESAWNMPYVSVFEMNDGDYIIYAEKDGRKGNRYHHFEMRRNASINNSETYTFVQLGKEEY